VNAPTKRRNAGAHVLVLDDDARFAELLAIRLDANGYRVSVATTAEAAFVHMRAQAVDALILDLRLREVNGLDVLASVRERAPDLPVIILTAHGTIDTAVEAMRRGAYGFLTKPYEDHDLLQKLAHAVESVALRREVAGLRRIVGAPGADQHLLGTSAAMARVREIVLRVAPTDATVLLTGESGTGKELAARSLHAASARAKGAFVAVNCGALPSDLLESALFGHTRGSFTGAVQDREGVFGAARGGTLFLDEVGEASLAVQVKLLRALQERKFTRVGSNVEEEADVRVVAATNRDLRDEIAAKRFREDLYYRLHVVPIAMPLLRDRVEDIPLLAKVFLERAAARHQIAAPRLEACALDLLLQWRWPGNVRELANALEAAVLLSGQGSLRAEHLVPLLRAPAGGEARAPTDGLDAGATDAVVDGPVRALRNPARQLPTLKEARDAFERAYLDEVLRRSSGSVTVAARLAGRNRSDLYDLLRRHGLSPAEYKEQPDPA